MAKYKFKRDSKMVESYVILILAGKRTFDQVPNIFNLREMVAEVLGLEQEQA
ncbi:CD1375 family protein [Aerococcaceae bacterium NML191219]|nr:CD1375 family protein [Aerococcaceae bacterium NML191219]